MDFLQVATPMHNKPLQTTLVCVMLLISACARTLSPQEVAAEFWEAMKAGDAVSVKRHVTAADALKLDSLENILPISNTELKRIVIDGDHAAIDTTVTVEGDNPLNFPLKTYLVLEAEAWKVDYSRTISAVENAGKLAAVIEKVHEFGDVLQQGIEQSVEELEQTLPQIEQELSRIEEQIKQHVPELRERLENFTKELEEALKRPPQTGPGTGPDAAQQPEDSVQI